MSRCSAGLGVQAVDLGITIDNVDYAVQDEELLEMIAGLRGILLCGGNRIRLVETLLHRGEESAVLRAIARAHSRGAALIAASGGASALSGVMIAGGSSWEALRYGVSSDTGHRGLVIQEGIGLFGGGIVDQNMLGGEPARTADRRLRRGGRALRDRRLRGQRRGRRAGGDPDRGGGPARLPAGRDRPDDADAAERQLRRRERPADGARARRPAGAAGGRRSPRAGPEPAALLGTLVEALARDAGVAVGGGGASSTIRGLTMRVRERRGGSALLDITCPRDDRA